MSETEYISNQYKDLKDTQIKPRDYPSSASAIKNSHPDRSAWITKGWVNPSNDPRYLVLFADILSGLYDIDIHIQRLV